MTDAYLVGGLRSPIGRYGGALATIRPDDLAARVLAGVVAAYPSVSWADLDEVILGCANQAGEDNRNVARMATLLAGLPEQVPATTVNRLCGSGLDAIAIGARAIMAGEADLVLAGGVESMSRAPYVMSKASRPFDRGLQTHDTTIGWRFVNPRFRELFGTDSMPETAENVAAEFDVSRVDQDAFACRSQHRAAQASANGRLAREIMPVVVPQSRGVTVTVEHDEQPRPTTLDGLAALPTPFRAGGTVTAGNSSGINDGAAAVLLASKGALQKYGLTALARVVSATTVGVAPRIMGMGPLTATRKLLDRTGRSIADFGVVEINEAFASQSLACLRGLGLADDAPHVNPNGGAIAFGHPLGMSGARLALTAALQLRQTDLPLALATMCIGVGQGIAVSLERT